MFRPSQSTILLAPAMLAMLAMSMLWVNYPFASADIYMQWDSMYLSIQLCKCYTMLSSLCKMLWECYLACEGCYGSAIQLVRGAMGVLSSLCRMLWECYLACMQCYAAYAGAM